MTCAQVLEGVCRISSESAAFMNDERPKTTEARWLQASSVVVLQTPTKKGGKDCKAALHSTRGGHVALGQGGERLGAEQHAALPRRGVLHLVQHRLGDVGIAAHAGISGEGRKMP
jgi:hypothetical protein